MTDRDETGKDGVLIINGEEYFFTTMEDEVSWETSDSDYNDKRHTHHRKTSKDSGGSIEVEGSQQELKSAIMNPDGTQTDDIRIIMSGSEEKDRYTGVTITNFGKEYPGGDATTTTLDWVANDHRPVNV